MKGPLKALLSGIVDYAGLFPPACDDMSTVTANFARYQEGPHAWMLGRLIVPEPRLGEFERALAGLPQGGSLFRISLLAGEDWQASSRRLAEFNRRRQAAVIDSVEVRSTDPASLAGRLSDFPPRLRLFVELPFTNQFEDFLSAIAKCQAFAKIRTGGVTPGSIPTIEQVAEAIAAFRRANIPFKCTAGLHHPVRGEHPLSYQARAERAVMHGFLNVFLAAALSHREAPDAWQLQSLLQETRPGAFRLREDSISWGDTSLSLHDLETSRKVFALSFGSCSFIEPLEDLEALRLL